jgi:hypothetical protein
MSNTPLASPLRLCSFLLGLGMRELRPALLGRTERHERSERDLRGRLVPDQLELPRLRDRRRDAVRRVRHALERKSRSVSWVFEQGVSARRRLGELRQRQGRGVSGADEICPAFAVRRGCRHP